MAPTSDSQQQRITNTVGNIRIRKKVLQQRSLQKKNNGQMSLLSHLTTEVGSGFHMGSKAGELSNSKIEHLGATTATRGCQPSDPVTERSI
jgi:hypothetical protein